MMNGYSMDPPERIGWVSEVQLNKDRKSVEIRTFSSIILEAFASKQLKKYSVGFSYLNQAYI